jgi:hypothetical protein
MADMRDVCGIGAGTTGLGKRPGMSFCDRTRNEYRAAPGLRIAGRAPTLEHAADTIERIADLPTNRIFGTSGNRGAAVVGDA